MTRLCRVASVVPANYDALGSGSGEVEGCSCPSTSLCWQFIRRSSRRTLPVFQELKKIRVDDRGVEVDASTVGDVHDDHHHGPHHTHTRTSHRRAPQPERSQGDAAEGLDAVGGRVQGGSPLERIEVKTFHQGVDEQGEPQLGKHWAPIANADTCWGAGFEPAPRPQTDSCRAAPIGVTSSRSLDALTGAVSTASL